MNTFKLRNGMVVKEATNEYTIRIGGWVDDYAVVSVPDGYTDEDNREVGSELCLLLDQGGVAMPVGGQYGKAYDMVEQLEDE